MDTVNTRRSRGLSLRKARLSDNTALGTICYEAFRTIAGKHRFPADFPSAEVSTDLLSMLLERPDVYSVLAEAGGKIVGSNFLWESDTVAGVGPITVDPKAQDTAIGKALMNDVLQQADKKGAVSVRLVQAAYHNRSLALYTKLGFDTVEPLSNIQGPPLRFEIEGYRVRHMTPVDIEAADALAFRIHGHNRHNEVAVSVQKGGARVVEHGGRITGYTTGVGFFGHTIGNSNEDLKALIGASDEFSGPGFLSSDEKR